MKHWTDQDITQWLYGVLEDSSHLDQCELCRGRASEAKTYRREVLSTQGDVSPNFLAAQRRAIYSRMELGKSFLRYRLAASMALVALVAVMSFNLLRRPTSYDPLSSPSDERLYSDMVAIDASTEPRAIQPIQNLFEE
jgi:hypothetical protein